MLLSPERAKRVKYLTIMRLLRSFFFFCGPDRGDIGKSLRQKWRKGLLMLTARSIFNKAEGEKEREGNEKAGVGKAETRLFFLFFFPKNYCERGVRRD